MREMNGKDLFRKLREEKIKVSISARFVFAVIVTVICSIALSYAICELLKLFLPFIEYIPFIVQLLIFSLAIAVLASWLLTKYFFAPIKKLRDGMQKISEGCFDVRLRDNVNTKELRELVAGFNMMAEELGSTEILQSDFVSNVSHEFKTPINAIEGYATLLQGYEGTDETENEYIEKILFNTKRLSSLVSNILLLSKIENQTLTLQKNEFDISEQIREEFLSLEPLWEAKSIEFDIEIEDLKYTGYENLLRHVWSNLIGNAIKFSHDGGEIKIVLKKEEGSVVFSVKDSGPGISDETKKHIFDKFYQGDTSRKSEGNGLGLALVKKIVTLSGGEITVCNIPEGGAKFTVTLH